MSIYKYFLCITTFLMHFKVLSSAGNKDIVVRNRGIENISPCAVGLVLFADVNNTSDEDLEVEVTPDQCCLDVGSEKNCHVLEMVGDCLMTIPRGNVRTIKMVTPITEPYERKGYCIVYLDSKPKNRQRGTMRDTIKINFNTHLKRIAKTMEIPGNVTICKRLDEDPLNGCKPVDCETFYNGQKSHFDSKAKRCVNIPNCVSETEDEIPNIILDYRKNKCVSGKSISKKDMDMIKELTSGERKPKDVVIIKNTYKTPNLNETKSKGEFNQAQQTLTKMFDSANKDNENSEQSLIGKTNFLICKYFVANRLTVVAFGTIILVQCFLICAMWYCFSSSCGCRNKKVIRKFFNYRQDASVTTPLICTSNNDTETTDFQYFSESSNIDRRIRCYKACQKDRKNNAKMSMSDDILSKFLARRDWNSKPAKSEAIPELIPVAEVDKLNKNEKEESAVHGSSYQNASNQSRKQQSKVNFENEKAKPKNDKKRSIVKSIVRRMDSKHRDSTDDMDYNPMRGELSEKEIKCHSYNDAEGNSNLTGFKPSSHSKRLGIFRSDKNKKSTVPSIERGAQAAFSNDSIDDFLSERGLIFLAGEDLSKYSFSSRSRDAKASSVSSAVSSKTSKNNMVKNVLSLLHMKSRHGPSSDPGAKKSDPHLDVELIHMSHASVYSSNNESEYLKSMKIAKDSRSSL